MGYMFHDAIIVTVNDRDAQRIHARAVEIFATFDDTPSTFKGETLVSDLTRGAVNCYPCPDRYPSPPGSPPASTANRRLPSAHHRLRRSAHRTVRSFLSVSNHRPTRRSQT